jgi:hypothetical protein
MELERALVISECWMYLATVVVQRRIDIEWLEWTASLMVAMRRLKVGVSAHD